MRISHWSSYVYSSDLTTLSEKREPAIKRKKIPLYVARNQVAEAQHGLREGRAIANGMNLTRLLRDLPPNVCTPTYLGNTAKKLAKEFKSLKIGRAHV